MIFRQILKWACLSQHGRDGLKVQLGYQVGCHFGGKGVQVQLHLPLQCSQPGIVELEEGQGGVDLVEGVQAIDVLGAQWFTFELGQVL